MKHIITFLSLFLLAFAAACASLPETGIAPVTGNGQEAKPLPADTQPVDTSTPDETGGATQPAENATESPQGGLNGEDIDQALAQAIESRDFNALRALMKDRFSFAIFNTELIEITSDEAIQRLQNASLAEGATPAVRWGTDVVALLNGYDPLGLWGPVAQPVQVMHVMGLGKNGTEEAVLVIAHDEATGRLYWHGILLPQFGYFQAADTDPNVLPTDVKYVMAKTDLNVRTGPGTNFAVEGLVWAGQIATVTGKSIDEDWWRISCTQDASGHCWISADPSLTGPTSAP